MIRKSAKPYLLLVAALVLMLSLPLTLSERLRSFTIALISPLGQRLAPSSGSEQKQELQKLQLENQRLHTSVTKFKELLLNERRLARQLHADDSEETEKLLTRHLEEMGYHVALDLQAVPAQVIFRSHSLWSSSLWLNVGSETNSTLQRAAIIKNCPVVVGNSVIGVVDYVGRKQSRVRLITDSGLTPSVRAVRGKIQDGLLLEQLSELEDRLRYRLGTEAKKEVLAHIQAVKDALQHNDDSNWYLAKGELHGSSQPLWRSQGLLLQGSGFNYDFPDEYGPARDLTTGMVYNDSSMEPIPLLQVGDLLVTTGMDGVFPAGLFVATVTKVAPLKEGDYYYDLEAKPTAGNLSELSLVYILPVEGYQVDDQPGADHNNNLQK